MTFPSEWIPSLQAAALLALEIALGVGAAAWLAGQTRSVLWRRTIWQAATLGLILLCLVEAAGLAGALRGWSRHWWLPQSPPTLTRFVPASDSSALALPDRAQLTAAFREKVAQRLAAGRHSSDPTPATSPAPSLAPAEPPAVLLDEPYLQGRSMPWPELIWLMGAGAALGVIYLARLFFFLLLFRERRRRVDDCLVARVEALAGRLGIRRRVRVFESSRLKGPVAFGCLRLRIGLPEAFTRTFSPEQQDAILAHELAHLAGRDPLWQGLADLMASVLWWHPLAWWTRHRLRVTAESAADEASLLVSGGPGLLAECLLRLATQVARRQPSGWIGATGPGFRSGLGQRIERLINLEGSWSPPKTVQSRAVKLVVPVALVAGAILSTAWARPNTQGDDMQSVRQTWKRSLATLALFTAVGGDPAGNSSAAAPGVALNLANPSAPGPAGLAQLPPGNAESDQSQPLEIYRQQLAAAGEPKPPTKPVLPGTPAVPATESPEPAEEAEPEAEPGQPGSVYQMDPRLLERYGLKPQGPGGRYGGPAPARPSRGKQQIEARLNQILLNEVLYDGLPLGEIVRDLKDQALRRDPAKQGINFLLSNVPELGTTTSGIDPTTGAPLPAAGVDVSNIIIRLHLRNVRLKDVLDAMTRVAEQPLKYSVEEYGIVFSPGPGQPFHTHTPAPPTVLLVRTFRVETNTFLAGLENAFGIYLQEKVDPAEVQALQDKLEAAQEELARRKVESTRPAPKDSAAREPSEPEVEIRRLTRLLGEATQGRPDRTRQIQQAVRQLLLQLGVNMDAPGKSVFYNDLTGVLMVRATPEEIEIVQAAIETLGGGALRSTSPQRADQQKPGGKVLF